MKDYNSRIADLIGYQIRDRTESDDPCMRADWSEGYTGALRDMRDAFRAHDNPSDLLQCLAKSIVDNSRAVDDAQRAFFMAGWDAAASEAQQVSVKIAPAPRPSPQRVSVKVVPDPRPAHEGAGAA